MFRYQRVALGFLEILLRHFSDQPLERDFRGPPQLLPRLRCVAKQSLDFGWSEVARVDLYDAAPAAVISLLIHAGSFPAQRHSDFRRGKLRKVTNAVLLTSRDDEILRL